MLHLLKTASVAALLVGIAATASFAEENTAWRLFISDHGEPIVRVLDVTSGKELDKLATKVPASLARSDSGKTIFAVQGKGDVVQAISSGISIGDHGDHGDLKVEDAKLLDVEFAGKKPSHFVDHGGDIALFFDGEGTARVTSEKDVLDGKANTRETKTDAPHHGLAVAFDGHVLLTEPNKDKPDELPVGIRVVDASGKQVGDVHACPDLHGEAASGNILAIACAKGLLIATSGDKEPSIGFLPYSETLPEGKSTTLVGGRGLQYFLGNYGPSAVVLIDPTSKDAFRRIELPTRRVHFAVDPVRPKFAYVFTEDGMLHQLDVVSGAITKSLPLTEPYSMDGHWSDPRPRIAVAGDAIFVTDPLKSTLHVIDAKNFAKTKDIAVEGKPFNIVAVGGSGETH
ncbi:zinc metallochaperone AztD [Mesorhizobium sp. YR577]|uniref:zinc metallochaperone AztD n=1 Tax=Mesorhizobium sp. YR577 TaxID=1884373 RepID=UPI0008F38162|nr:zinc metallochaperone AztD [Mesorhizobium sp. YR577]SFT72594.1 hypothetical protein SAMN05518861_104136 [Mesorhizobium sp. YR577]